MAARRREEVAEATVRLHEWIVRNGWAGYDPYDVRAHPLILRLLRPNVHIASAVIAKPILRTTDIFPFFSRRLLRIPKQVNAKAMGLLASAYLRLYQQSGQECYFDKSLQCISWLEWNKAQGYSGACWGYPFDWQSLVFIPSHTPSSVVTSICGDAFWDFYRFTGEERYLDICESICRFFTTDLNVDRIDSQRICFSYTPVDRFHVHNANLLVAAFLVRIGKELRREDLYEKGMHAMTYTSGAQNEDGSFYYWALDDKEKYHMADSTLKNIDHYHTGFVLRSLHSIFKATDDPQALRALTSGYRFYRDNLFANKTVPIMRPRSPYPVNIHSCAESILCMSTLSEVFTDAQEYAWNAFLWTRANMQDRDGHFYYMKTLFTTIKMPYIRWGQAWMLTALATLLTSLPEQETR